LTNVYKQKNKKPFVIPAKAGIQKRVCASYESFADALRARISSGFRISASLRSACPE